jgi:hypothetical protein
VPIAGPRQALSRPLIHLGREIRVRRRDPPLPDPAVEGRAFLHDQRIGREMFRAPGQDSLQGLLPAAQGLAGQPVDEVHVQVGEAGGAGHREMIMGFLKGVIPAQQAQLLRMGALHPEAQAVDPQGPHALEIGHGEAAGVRLHGDLDPGRDLEGLPERLEQALEKRERQQRGGPTADVNRAGAGPPGRPAEPPDLLSQRRDVGGEPARHPCVDVEITVAATPAAEGDVDINRQGLLRPGGEGGPGRRRERFHPRASFNRSATARGSPASIRASSGA